MAVRRLLMRDATWQAFDREAPGTVPGTGKRVEPPPAASAEARASGGFEGGRSPPRQPQCMTLGRQAAKAPNHGK